VLCNTFEGIKSKKLRFFEDEDEGFAERDFSSYKLLLEAASSIALLSIIL
jgi:hypothetical protein